MSVPRSWDEDRQRCRDTGIPDEVRYRPKWRIALDQLLRLDAHGISFDWLVFDEGYHQRRNEATTASHKKRRQKCLI